ncbi:hypothetical protein HNR39_003725 [Glaciimonas immobilis]|uniref:Uncharacterized protein n=1 Tax=Glaciimonas immobilis TaxID=728004 RepID=A0A840RW95_9BURK|nr:hypothetical protein [Glaciimonas immobilis]
MLWHNIIILLKKFKILFLLTVRVDSRERIFGSIYM